jgi:hypothetical protein
MPDKIKEVYELISDKGYFTDENEFRSYVTDPNKRSEVFDLIKDDGYFTDKVEFDSYFEDTLKKKEPIYPGLKDAFGISLRGPLMEKSNLPQTTKKVKQPLKSDLKAEELKSIETNLAKENVELSQIKQKLTSLEKSGKLQDPSVQTEYNGLVNQYNERQKSAKTQFDKYHKEHGNYRTLVRDEQNADLKKGINTSKGVLNKINTYDATLKQVGLRYGQTQVALEEALQAGDNEAAAQLQGQLKKDEAIIKNLDELIKTGKRVAAAQEQDSFGNNINIGIYQALGTILQSPQGLTKAALTPIMEYGMGLDPVQRELMFRTLAKLDPNMMASETLGEFGGEVSKFAEERKQMANMNRLYNGSAYNALLKGDVTKAVTYAAKDFANSLPSSTMYATGAGAALMSAGMVGDEIRKTEEETGQAIGSKEILTASIKAGLEVVTERMFGDGKAAVELVKRLGKAGAEKAISDAVKEVAKKGLGRKLAENAGEEVVGESINQIGANAADIYINGKKNVSLWDGVGDAAIIALVGGGVYGGALTTANHYIDKARIKEAEDLKSQAANYMEQSMMQQNPAAAQVLEEKANTLNLEAQNIVDKEQEIALNANPETMDAIIALENDKEQLEEALQEEGLPEEVSAVIEEKLSTLQVEHNELIVQATKEAEQNIKAEEEEISQPIDVTGFLKGDTKEENVPLIDEVNNTEVVEPQDQKRSEKVEEPLRDVESTAKTMDDFDTFKDAVAYNVKRTADIGIDESEANYGDAKNINEIKSDLEKAGIQVEKVSQSSMSDGNYASFDGEKIKVTDENIPLQVLLHEIGEKVVLDLDKAKQKIEHANNIFEAVTTYGASRGNDAFADNFYLYFLSPKTLKELSPNVYAELNKLIPQNIKDLGKSLMSKYGVTEQTLKYNKPKAVESLLSKEQTTEVKVEAKEEVDKNWTPPTQPDNVNTFPLLKGTDVVRYIPESVAQKAWDVWNEEYKTGQSLQRTKERGGFGINEMDMFYPNWRAESSQINSKEQTTEVKEQAVDAEKTDKKPAKEQKEGNKEQAKSPFDLVAIEEKAYRQKQEETKQEAKKDIELINSDDEATIEKYFKKSRYKEMPDGKGYYFSTGSSRIIKQTKKQVALDTAKNIVNKKPLLLPQSRVQEIVEEFEANKTKQTTTNKQQEDAIKEGKQPKDDKQEYQGIDGQQQGEQEDRTNQEGNVPQSQVETGSSGGFIKSGKEQKVKSKLTPDEAVSNLEGLKVKEVKPKEAKPKKKKLPSRKAINKLDPTIPSDFIALALVNTFISTDSFNNANDRNNLKVEGKKFPSVRMNYLRKNGMSLDQLVVDLANDKVAFPFEKSEDTIRELIIEFMLDNPNGPNAYAVEMLNAPDAEQEYYDRQQAEYEQMLSEENEQREAELDAIETAWVQLENDIETLSEEDIDKILSLMTEDDTENINNIIESNNEKQDVRGKEDGSVVVSENEGSQKSNTGKSREELEAKVKEKKSAVDKAQNALSKAKANLEKAVSESQKNIFGKAEAESKLFAPDLKALNKVISEKEGILALAKESLQKANDELTSWTPENQTKISFDNAITFLNGLKVDTKNKSFDAILGLPVLTWNAAIDTITKAIEAGVTVSDAIKRGLNYIQKNHRGAWDKKSFNTKVIEELGLRGIEVNGEDLIVKPVEKEFASVVDGFYSDLEQSLLDTKKDNLSGTEWISTLGNSDEAKWTGLSDWLNSQEGKVSKTDIRSYLKDNRISVVEVVKGEPIGSIKKVSDLPETFIAEGFEFSKFEGKWVRQREGGSVGEFITDERALKHYNDEQGYASGDEKSLTKFSQYQLEGEKENYKEILVTLPSKEVSYSAYKFDSNNDSGLGAVEGDWIIKNNRGEDVSFVEADYAETEEDAMQEFELNQLPYEKDSENMLGKEVKFKSTHFEEINILVHLRMNTRTDSEGNKVLFLEEVQSDWGQQGKKEGFIDKLVIPEGLIRQNDKGEWRIANIYDPKVKFETKEKAESYYRENYNLGKSSKIYSAPFVTDTNDWTKLGLKVALKEAVKQGADKIAWTTGEQQVGRYENDFRKQVDKIETYKRISADVPSVHVIASKGSSQVFDHIIPINGKTIVSGKEVDLEDVVGKEIANKIRNSEEKQQSFEGDALTIGGKGMEDFYGKPSDAIRSKNFTIKKEGELFAVKDEKGKTIRTFKQENEANKFKENYGLGIVGNVAKSLFNQEVGTVVISKGDAEKNIETKTLDELNNANKGNKDLWIENKENGNIFSASYTEAKDALNKGYKVGYLDKGKDNSTQYSIDITPELKASVESGLPLFGNIIKTLEKLKLEAGKAGRGMNAFGIAPALWNAGLDTIILAIKGGVALADAVQKGIQYWKDNNVEFDEAKVTAHLEEKVGLKRTKQQPNEKDNKEEPMLEEPRDGGDEGKKGSEGPKLRAGEEGERKIRRHFKTIVNNESLKEAVKFMLENDFAYNVKSMDRSLSRAKAYLEKNGIEDSYTNFITYGEKIEGLTGDEAIALAFLIQTMINSSMIKEAENGNQELADALNDDFYRMSEKIAEIGTEAGRIVNAFNLFILDMSNPISAQMALNRISKKAENEAKASDSKERKKAEAKTKAVTNEVNKGKRKTTQEVVKYAEQITKEDEELGDIIFKGSKKPISDETKAKISNFFDKMKSGSKGKTLASIIPGGPIIWDAFIEGVKKLVVDGGIPLTNAIAKVYSEMASTTDKKTLDEVRDAFVKEAGVNPQQVAKRIQAQKKKESERLQKEKDTLEKELQKERDRVAKLRAKEKESQQARIEEQSAKLALQEAKDAQKAVEKQLKADRVEKQKTLTKAKKEALDIELKAAEQKQKDAQKVLDLADAMALKTIQNELKESQKKEKQLEKDIEKLGKELVRNRLFDDLVADLVDEYINMKGDTKNEDLIKLVEERLGVKGDKAFKIANKIRESVYNNVTKRVSDRFEKEIETEKKRREGTLKKADPKTGEQIVDELVFAINTRMMTADMMMDLFPSKYGMVNFTGEDFKKVRELSQAIATAPSAERKAIAIKNFLEYLHSFKPYYFAEFMNELWYFDVLSGVLTLGLATGDVNNFYNFIQVSTMAKELPIVTVLNGLRRAIENKSLGDYGLTNVKDIILGFSKGVFQTMVRPTNNEVTSATNWVKLAVKNNALLGESRAAFVEAFTKDTASFTDFENPFKNSSLGTFDIQRLWDGAKKNQSKDKKGLAYLYWLAVEKVYNFGAAAFRFMTPILNKAVPQVGKTLAAQDLAFGGIIKNAYSPTILREILIKEGFKGEELEAEITRRITNSEEEMAAAKYTAINWRMKYDIGFQQNSDGKWNIYDNGKVVKKMYLLKLQPINFGTLEAAEDYARTVVAPSGSRYKLDVISQLNLKLGRETANAAKRISSFNLLTKASMGHTGSVLAGLNWASNKLQGWSNSISENASLQDKTAIRYALNYAATLPIFLSHIFAFLKVGTGLSRITSQYFTPIGLARAIRADVQNKSLFGKELEEKLTKTEVNMLYAKVIMGIFPSYLAATMVMRLFKDKDDEEKDKKKKELVLTKEEQKFLDLIEKRNKIKLTDKQKKVLTAIKPGDITGSFQWMGRDELRFYTSNNIIKESAVFDGYDEQGNRMWSSLSAYPNYIFAESIATAAWFDYLKKDDDERSAAMQFAIHPLYKFIDLSIGQGIVKYFASNTSTENKLEALFQTVVMDQFGVVNPNILTAVMKYVDGKARKNETIYDYYLNYQQEEGTFLDNLNFIGAYMYDKNIPVKGAVYDAFQAPLIYGQFGEEMFRVPSEKQGYFSALIGYYQSKDKNLEQKAMNEFFFSIGRKDLWTPPKTPIVDENFKKHKLTPRQRDEYGMLAGRVSFEQLKTLKPLIQNVYQKVDEKAANTLIDNIFSVNYINMAAYKLGLITQKEFDRMSTENVAVQMAQATSKIDITKVDKEYYESLNVTEKEKQLIEDMKKVTNSDNKKAIFLKEMSKLKSEEEIIPYLERMLTLKVMSSEMFNELFNYKYLNGKIGANIPQRLQELETQEED